MKKIYFGTMDILAQDMKTSIKAALDAGYYGIDTAWRYYNEKSIGQALAELQAEGYRDIKIQTKIWPSFFDDPNAILTVQLQDLKVQKIDSLLLHRPSVDFRKTVFAWEQLIKIKQAGLVNHIGVSNFDKDMIQILIAATGVVPEMNQIELSITNFRADRYHYLKAQGIEIQAWSPMGQNLHTLLNNVTIIKLAQQYQVSKGTIIISYLTSQGIVPVLKSTNYNHIFEMQKLVQLTKTDIANLKKYNTFNNKASETYTFKEILPPTA